MSQRQDLSGYQFAAMSKYVYLPLRSSSRT